MRFARRATSKPARSQAQRSTSGGHWDAGHGHILAAPSRLGRTWNAPQQSSRSLPDSWMITLIRQASDAILSNDRPTCALTAPLD